MATFGISIYIDGIKISDTQFIAEDDFEITSTGLAINGTQVWTYSGDLIFGGFTQLNSFPAGTTGNLSDFAITSNKYIYLNTLAHAEYYKASYTDLSSVANAVRHKLGISDKLEFPVDFVDAIEEIPSSGANTAIIDIEVVNGTATITGGEFPDWCIGVNSDLIWGTISINSGFVAGNIDSGGMDCRVYYTFTDNGISSIVGYSLDEGLSFGITTDLSMVGFIIDPASQDGFVPMTSGAFEVILIYCDPFEPTTPSDPIEDDTGGK